MENGDDIGLVASLVSSINNPSPAVSSLDGCGSGQAPPEETEGFLSNWRPGFLPDTHSRRDLMQEQDGKQVQKGSEDNADRRGNPIENPPANISPKTDPPPPPPPYGGPKGGGDDHGNH
jgi:hypothetical protein